MQTLDQKLEEIISLDKQYFLNTFGPRTPFCAVKGDGVWLYGSDNKKYMDLIGGIAVNVLGHARPELTAAICQQANQLIHCSNYYYNEPQTLLAKKLATLFGSGKVFFSNSGAEANEGAIKLVRGYFHKKGKPRAKIVSTQQSFHGRTLATAAATGQARYSDPFAPLPPGFVHIPFNDIEALQAEVTADTGAVLLELIQGESGIREADKGFVQLAAQLCQETGAKLIIDEIQTGMGRTGRFFAFEHYEIKPDIVTLAKGLGGGVPIGALISSETTASGFEPGDHGTTFGGNPLACAAALAVLEVYQKDELMAKAAELGTFLLSKLGVLKNENEKIADIRGLGLMIGIELKDPVALKLKQKLFEAGFLVGSVGSNIIRLLPPLIIEQAHLELFCQQLQVILAEDF